MDRAALLLYLQNVRDLEVAQYRLNAMFQSENNAYNQQVRQLPTDVNDVEYIEPPEKNYTVSLGISIACACLFGVCFAADAPFFGAICFLGAIGFLISFFVKRASYKEDVAYCIQENEKAVKNHQEQLVRAKNNSIRVTKLLNTWKQRDAWFRKEYANASKILNGFYAMNVLPSQYRNLSAACYIYDYMSTSQATFEETLIHEHMENGIQRLESKLNDIIYRLEDVVYETRCMRAENQQAMERVISQNNAMLDHLQQIEANTENAAAYAELSSNYSKANAYFSAAKYLRSR